MKDQSYFNNSLPNKRFEADAPNIGAPLKLALDDFHLNNPEDILSENQMDIVVTEMPRASVLEDGSVAEMEFKNSNGSIQLLRFSPSTMMSFVNRVFELFLNQKIQEAASLGHMEVQPLPAVVTAAQETVGGEAVILSIRLRTGLPVAFAIPPAEAEELHKQLGKAVKKARRQASNARH